MLLQVDLRAEDNKFIFFALGLSAEVVVSIEVISQLGVVVVKILDSFSVTQETEEMFSSQMFDRRLFFIYFSIVDNVIIFLIILWKF